MDTKSERPQPLQFSTDDTGMGGRFLLCPACGGMSLHHDTVDVYEPYEEDAKAGLHLTVRSHWAAVPGQPSLDFSPSMAGHPGHRRNSLTIRFWCEECTAYSLLRLIQLDGSTHMEMVVTNDKRPAWEDLSG